MTAHSKFKKLIRNINWYPPYLGAGIRVKEAKEDFSGFVVEMKLRWYNRNMFGTQFGGSLYAMTDPFFVFILSMNLGNEYIVWDQAASIQFLKPGRKTVTAEFTIPKERIEQIRTEVNVKRKGTYTFTTEIKDTDNLVIARVEKQIYVRRKA